MGEILNMNPSGQHTPRVVVVGLASCFGCQLQITNAERYLVDILGQIDLQYWQLADSSPMPSEFDVAVIEGAVTTQESKDLVIALRDKASAVIAIGSCALTAGVTGMAAPRYRTRAKQVYGSVPEICDDAISPCAVGDVIAVDYEVRCCPIDPMDFVAVLHRALIGSNRFTPTSTLCGECKRNERNCFYASGQLCLGLVTRAGCGAKCVNLGRPCNGCAGLSPDSNLAAARVACKRAGVSVADFDQALEMFNQTNPMFSAGGK